MEGGGSSAFPFESGDAAAAAIRALFSARIDELRRRLPPDQAAAAVQAVLREQRAVIAEMRERRRWRSAGRRYQQGIDVPALAQGP